MCGIVGFFGEDRAKAERMVQALKHRGPDGQGVAIAHGASLGHARLAILDPSPRGTQPMWNTTKTIAIVYNGEIFNYRELIRLHNLQCQTGTDTEVLLHLYERYGIQFVSKLRGMFAFGIYDTTTRTWHLVRDTSGIKPLYIAFPEGKLHFASEVRTLMSAFPTKPGINYTALSHYLRLQYVPGPMTLCTGIDQLQPGTILSISENGHEQRHQFSVETNPIWFKSEAEFAEEFPLLMERAVSDHLISDRPLGLFLSGGMDSSIVLHHMARIQKEPVRTFTIRFEASEEEDGPRFNRDADVALESSKHYGTHHTEILLTAAMYKDLYRSATRALDLPNADSVAVAQYALSQAAKPHVDVVLCGAGGDELFGGYPRYRITKLLQYIQWIPLALRRSIGLAWKKGSVFGYNPGPLLAERLLTRSLAETMSITRGEWFDTQCTGTMFEDKFTKLNKRWNDPLRAAMEFDRALWLPDESLKLCDGITMAHGLECRVPFLDPRIITAAQAMPSSMHVGYTETKRLLKKTYAPLLPECTRRIGKASFYPPLAKWLRRECKSLAENMLEHEKIRELFDSEKVRMIFTDHCTHRRYGLHTLSSLIQLQHWFDEVYNVQD